MHYNVEHVVVGEGTMTMMMVKVPTRLSRSTYEIISRVPVINIKGKLQFDVSLRRNV